MYLDTARTNLRTLLAVEGEQFVVPRYQRPYSWEPEHVDELWEDMLESLSSEHFMGTLVLNTQEESALQVIDGQQRLTTLMMFLSLIRDDYYDLDAEIRNRPHRYLFSDEYKDDDRRFKLRIGRGNWSEFRDFIVRSPADASRRPWEERSDLSRASRIRNEELFGNRKRIRELLDEFLGTRQGPQRVARLEALEKKILDRLVFVTIRVRDLSDAFLLFETLNDRGLGLSAADLLRSHLLGKIAAQTDDEEALDVAAAKWDRLVEDLGTTDVSRFLRHHLLSIHSKVLKDEIFRKFKQQVVDQGPFEVLHELRLVGSHYSEFLNPAKSEYPEFTDVLNDLREIGAATGYVALLPARRWLGVEDFIQFARLVEALTYRWSVITKKNAQELETVFHNAAKELRESNGGKVQEASKILIDALPTSVEFEEGFMRQRMGTKYIARYTLRRVENAVTTDHEKELKASAKVHIEHICPQSISDAWWQEHLAPEVAERHASIVGRWGNLTLLSSPWNIQASNSAFPEKQKKYSLSDVSITSLLTRETNWREEEVDRRQRWLALIADQIWGLKGVVGNLPVDIPAYPMPEDV